MAALPRPVLLSFYQELASTGGAATCFARETAAKGREFILANRLDYDIEAAAEEPLSNRRVVKVAWGLVYVGLRVHKAYKLSEFGVALRLIGL